MEKSRDEVVRSRKRRARDFARCSFVITVFLRGELISRKHHEGLIAAPKIPDQEREKEISKRKK